MTQKENLIMKKNATIIISAIYIFSTMLALNLTYLFSEHTTLIVTAYLSFMCVFLCINIIVYHQSRKRKIQKNKKMISSLLENINAMAIIWESDLSFVNVNSHFTDTTGFTNEDLKDIEILHNILPKEAYMKNQLDAFLEKKDNQMEIVTKNNKHIISTWNNSVIKSRRSSSLIMSIGVDVTEAAEMQKEITSYSKSLADSEDRYTLSMELSEIGILLRKKDSNNFFISKQLQLMLGIKSDYISITGLREKVHPNDAILFDAFCDISLINSDPHKIHNLEMRIFSHDKTYRWYSFRYKISLDENGEPLTIGGAIIDISNDKEKDSLIEKMAYIDEVTEIYNRNKFMLIGEETFDCANDLGLSYWVIVIDIDKFHIINDTCGYQNGNRLLKEVAITILRNTTVGGFGARIGGDNFALIIKDDGDINLPVKTIKQIQSELKDLANDVFSNQTITCSGGYCKMPDDGEEFANILDHAEFALSVNDDARGNITRYDSKLYFKIIAGNTLEIELAKALDNNELVLYYQPKINLANGKVFGVEALIRWIKPDGTIIPPNYFIPVAEKSLLITRISDFVIYEACRQNKEWQDLGLPFITVSINLTSVDFYQTDVKDSISSALSQTGLAAEWLEVELTESLALKDVEQAIHQMKELKKLGVKLAMDDFGTGYSSLSYIQVLPITLLKLDRSFIMYLEDDEVSREIVSAVIKIAKSKKIETIAEGIETLAQAQILKQSGCDHAQGFFFGKPMPAPEFVEFMKKNMPVIV